MCVRGQTNGIEDPRVSADDEEPGHLNCVFNHRMTPDKDGGAWAEPRECDRMFSQTMNCAQTLYRS